VKPTAVIVGGSATWRAELREMLEGTHRIDVAAEAADGGEGIRILDEVQPDIVLIRCDLQDRSWHDVVHGTVSDPAVVLLAESDRDAVAAFEAGVVDYVLVPFTPERLAEGVERAVGRAAGRRRAASPERADLPASDGDLRRLFLRERDGIVPVPVGGIVRFEADGDYVVVHRRERRHLVRMRLQDLEAGLGERFLRAHRSHLVNLDHVRIFEHREDGRLVVVMDDGTRIVASRSRSRDVRRRAL
jgi:two-component system LytT family response regulator